MPKDLKHLKYFSNYIAEQDFSEDPIAAEGEKSVAPKEPIYSFIFIDKDDDGSYTYPDGSSSRRYDTYEIKKLDLNNWIDKNITVNDGLSKSAVDVKRKAFLDYISGVKSSLAPDDKKYIEKFKNSVKTEVIAKQIQDTEVIFSNKDKRPTTDSVDVTFITLPEK